MTINPQPGDAGFSTIPGMVGKVPLWGQVAIGDACRFDHVFLVVNALDDEEYPDGRIIQAMPRGAEYRPLRQRIAPGFAYASIPLTDEQRWRIPDAAGRYFGVGYSWLSYPAIAAVKRGLPIPHLKAYIANSGRLICSQLIDRILFDVGYHLFSDKRWFADVTPGDVYYATDPRVIDPAPPAVDGA